MKPIAVLQVAQADGEVIITNDGATILNKMRVEQPAAKMLVDLAKSQVRLDCCSIDNLTIMVMFVQPIAKELVDLAKSQVRLYLPPLLIRCP